MSDEGPGEPAAPEPEFAWRGFAGPAADAIAGKAAHEAMMAMIPPPIAAVAPPAGAPPMAWNKAGTQLTYAVMVRRGATIATPAGLEEVDEAIVARVVNA